MAGQLFVVATPIGNLGDITLRAKDTLASVDVVLAEDTRVTGKLLAALGINVRLESVHEHTDERKLRDVVARLIGGATMALVTDAGTPAISDPGGKLVAEAVRAGVVVTPMPGPSAFVAALSIAGVPLDRFTFLGFPPNKKGRQTFFKEALALEHAAVFYESTHRIEKTLEALAESGRSLVVCRELTKMHETIYRGSATEIMSMLKETSSKGEFVIIVCPPSTSLPPSRTSTPTRTSDTH